MRSQPQLITWLQFGWDSEAENQAKSCPDSQNTETTEVANELFQVAKFMAICYTEVEN